MKHYYPAIFTPRADYFEVIIPFTGCAAQGNSIGECMQAAQQAVGLMFKDLAEKDYPAPKKITDLDLENYPEGSFASFICFDKEAYDATVILTERQAILNSDCPIKELLNRRHMKIKELADFLGAPYRTVQDWSLGKTKPPQWVLNLILDKILD